MRTSKRIGTVVLAGTLLLTMGFGSLALADQAATDTGAASAEAQAQDVAQATLSLKTIAVGGFQFQAGAGLSWDITEDGDSASYQYTAEDAMVSLEIYQGDASYITEMLANDPAALFTEGMDAQVTSERHYMLDGMQAYSLGYTATEDGVQYSVVATVMGGSSGAAVATIIWTEATDADTVWMLEQIARSLGPVASAAAEDGGEALEVLDGGQTTMEGTAAGSDATPTVSNGTVLELPKWTVEVSTDPATFLYTTAESWDEAVNGKAVIGVPVALTNTGTESSAPWWDLTIGLYGPNGVQQGSGNISAAGWYFDDSLESLNNLRAGASTTAYLYFYDEGDGEYVAELSAWDENFNTVGGEVALNIAR